MSEMQNEFIPNFQNLKITIQSIKYPVSFLVGDAKIFSHPILSFHNKISPEENPLIEYIGMVIANTNENSKAIIYLESELLIESPDKEPLGLKIHKCLMFLYEFLNDKIKEENIIDENKSLFSLPEFPYKILP